MSLYGDLQTRWTGHGPTLRTPEGIVGAAELADRVARARGLLRSQGLGRGSRLAIQLPRCLALLELHLACLAEGIATLPMNPRYTDHERDWILGDAEPALVVDDPMLARTQLDASLPYDGPVEATDDDIALLCYTSGTTGRPKGAQIRHANLRATIAALHDAWAFTPDDVLLHALPLFHIHGLVVAQHVALWAGCTTHWLAKFDADRILDVLESGEATVFMGVPTFYNRLLATGRCGQLPIRLLTSGSAPLPARVWHEIRQRFGQEVLERYGMTEVGIVLSNPYEGLRVPGSVGKPVGQTRVRVVDEDDQDCAVGEVGQVLIAGPSVFRGYLNRPRATETALRGGWMHTGDLGLIDERGYVHLRGRSGDLILVGGFNVYPPEVEAVLLDHPAVDQAIVIGVPDDDLGERVVVAVILNEDIPVASLREFAASRLTAYKVPTEIRRVDAYPRNAMGKVQRAVMRQDWDDETPPTRAPFATELREARARLEHCGRASIDLARLAEYPADVGRGETPMIDDQFIREILDTWMPDDPEATVARCRALLTPWADEVHAVRAAAETIAKQQHEALHHPRFKEFLEQFQQLSTEHSAVHDRANAYTELRDALLSVVDAVRDYRTRGNAVEAYLRSDVLASSAASLWKTIEALDVGHLLVEPTDDVLEWLDVLEAKALQILEEDAQTVDDLVKRSTELGARLQEMMG